ncbi:MAG TPA: hypothetical protein VHI31_00325 [Actinomycetota bacterium]|nr:hypothetical protein [Actinomycetota bacterium]
MTKIRRTACAVLACLVLGGACTPEVGFDAESDAPSPNIHTFATPENVGTGLLDGATLDGSALFIEEPDPAFPQPGCEGQPQSVMFRLPLQEGEKTVVGNGTDPLRGRLVRGGSGGRTAVVAACESFFAGLVIAEESDDGTLSDLKSVTPAIPEGFLLNPSTVAWARDGKKLLGAVQDIDAPDGDPAQIVSIDPESGRLTKLFDAEQGTGVFNVGQMQNGDYVVATNLVVSFRSARGAVKASFQGQGFQITPDRRRLVVFGSNVRLASQGDTRATQVVEEKEGLEVSAVELSPDGQAVAFKRYALETGQVELSVVSLDDRRVTNIVTGHQYDRPVFTGDGKGLAFNLYTGEPDYTTEVYLARFEAS